MVVQANIMGPDLIIFAIIILVLFGGKKIPELAKGLGEGIKSFKEATRENPPAATETPAAPPAPAAPTVAAPAAATTATVASAESPKVKPVDPTPPAH